MNFIKKENNLMEDMEANLKKIVKSQLDNNEFKKIIELDTKKLTPAKEVENLENFGWVFDLSNVEDAEDEERLFEDET